MTRRPAWQIIAWFCAAHVASMTAFSTYPALLPQLQAQWALSNTAAGLVSGLFFAGYMAAVPVLTALTDRIDARRIYLASSLVAALGAAGFGWLAQGAASGGFFQLLVGIGVAGTYMPGLRALTDNTSGPAQSRAVSFYTGFFGIGVSLSLVLASAVAAIAGWRWAFAASGVGPLVAAAMIVLGLPAAAPRARPADLHLLDFRPVLRNREACRYIYGYTMHCWELFASRSWMVAFLTFAQSHAPAPLSPAAVHAIANLVSPFASIAGNEAALRAGRARVIVLGMAASGALTCAVGFLAGLPWIFMLAVVVLHMVLVMSDSSTLTAGMVAAADPALRGATMAVHSTLGFGAGFVSPLVLGAALDLAGGNQSAAAWGIAFASVGIAAVVAPFALGFAGRRARG